MERRRELETRRLVTVVLLFCALAVPLFTVAGCGEQLTRMEESQIRLQAMVAANARDLATISEQVHAGQGKMSDSFQALDGQTRQVGAQVATVRDEQQQFRTAVAAGQTGLNKGIIQVQNSQQEIQTNLGVLRQADEGLTRDVAALAAQNDTLYATLQDSNRQLTEQLVTLTSGHEQLYADIANVHTLMQTMGTDLTAAHTSLQQQLGADQKNLTARLTGMSTAQQQLQAGLETLGGKADQANADLAETRSSLQEAVRVSREVLTGQMAASLQNQDTLQGEVRGLGDKADKLTENISEVAAAQATLHQTLQANHDTALTAMTGLSDGQQTLRGGIGTLDTKADRLAGNVAALATQQQALGETIAANHDVVTARLGDLSATQTSLQGGLTNLDGKADALASAQSTLRQTLERHDENTSADAAGLADGQQALRTQMDVLAATADKTSLDVLALSDGQTALQETVRATADNLGDQAGQTLAGISDVTRQQTSLQQSLEAGHATLAARATQLAENQQELQGRMDNLDQATQQVAAGLAGVTAGQNTLQQALQTHSDHTTEQGKIVAQGQHEVKASLDTLTATTSQAALGVIALGNSQTESARAFQSAVADLGTRTDKVAAGLHSVSAEQTSLQESVSRQGRDTAAQITQLTNGQQQIRNGLETLTDATHQTGLDVVALGKSQTQSTRTLQAAVTAGQSSLSDALERQGQAVSSQVAKLADGQQQMQGRLDTLTATTGQTALDVIGMTTRQEAMQSALQDQSQVLGTQVAQLGDNQKQIQSGLDTLTATAGQASLDVLTLKDGQEGLTRTVQAAATDLGTRTDKVASGLAAVTAGQSSLNDALERQGQAVSSQVANLADGQQQMQGRLDTLTTTTGQTALDVIGMTTRQEAMQSALQDRSQALSTQVAQLADTHQQIQGGLDTLTATAGQASLDVLALKDGQEGLARTVQATATDLGTQTDKVANGLAAVTAAQYSLNDTLERQGQAVSRDVARLADDQQQMQGRLDTLTATTGQTALDVLGITTRQEAMHSALRDHSETWGAQMAQLANGQQQVHNSLDTLTATAGQTALDVMAMTTGQEAIRTTLQSHDQVSATRMAELQANQQQIRNSVDIVTATTGQASLDTIALSNRQEQLGQAVRAGQQEAADRLDAIAQSQQGWSDRLDAAQAKITTMAGDLAGLERQIGTLQTALRAGLQDTTALLGATDQQRLQFETKVSQDVQAVIEALGQLRRMQDSLQEQIVEVHNSTQGQADSLRSVLEQIKAMPNLTDGIRPHAPSMEDQAGVSAAPRPAAEVRVSSATQRPQVPEPPHPPEATE